MAKRALKMKLPKPIKKKNRDIIILVQEKPGTSMKDMDIWQERSGNPA